MKATLAWLVAALLLAAVLPASAQKEKPPPVHPKSGPTTIKLNNDVTLKLPTGFIFLDKPDTDAMMRYMGNPPSKDEIGLVTKDDSNWFILISYTTPGHISDSDATQLDADELFKNFQAGTEQGNQERKKMGVAPLELKGWAEKPRYEAPTHHLIWALNGHSTEGDVVNYFTRILGREGLLSLNLVCSPTELNGARGDLNTVLDSVSFNPGQAYGDFQAGRDRDSGMSLTSLILGGSAAAAAAKLGIFAKLGNWLVVMVLALKKFVVLIVVAIGAGLKNLAGRNKSEPTISASDEPPVPPA